MILSDHHEDIFREILAERKRQAEKFPADESGDLDCFVMLAVLGEEIGEANQAALKMREVLLDRDCIDDSRGALDRNFRAELVQVAAVAFKMLEAHAGGRLFIEDHRADADAAGEDAGGEDAADEIGSPS